MDLNSKEKELCRNKPLQTVRLYRERTGLGVFDAKEAIEQELGIDFSVYERVRDRIAFSFFYVDWLWEKDGCEDSEEDFQVALVDWRELRRRIDEWPWNNGRHAGDCTNKPMRCLRCFVEGFYEQADKILSLDDEDVYDDADARDDVIKRNINSKINNKNKEINQ